MRFLASAVYRIIVDGQCITIYSRVYHNAWIKLSHQINDSQGFMAIQNLITS